jgi:hypothetical protein
MEDQGDAVLADDVELPAEPDVANAPAALNPLAVVSVVLGFLWLFWVGSLMAIAFGHVAKRQIDESDGTQRGHDLAVAGLTLGWAAFGLLVVFVVLAALTLVIGGGHSTPIYPSSSQ